MYTVTITFLDGHKVEIDNIANFRFVLFTVRKASGKYTTTFAVHYGDQLAAKGTMSHGKLKYQTYPCNVPDDVIRPLIGKIIVKAGYVGMMTPPFLCILSATIDHVNGYVLRGQFGLPMTVPVEVVEQLKQTDTYAQNPYCNSGEFYYYLDYYVQELKDKASDFVAQQLTNNKTK